MRCKALFVLGLLCLLPAESLAAPRLTLGPCAGPKLPKDARCGTWEVFENRAAKKGRKIPLRVVVLPALGKDWLGRTVDLTQYTTDNAVDDVDEVRAALGYPRLNLTGSSYGSRAVLVYLRRHPESARTAILDGVAQTHDRGPLFFAAPPRELWTPWSRNARRMRAAPGPSPI
jgi:pimeloyl-ACP methyl ester carboxylesterase